MNAGHVCIVTSAHPLDDVRVHTKFAESFLQNDWKVSWVGPDIALFDPTNARNPKISYFLTKSGASRLDRILASFRLRTAARPVSNVDWWYSPDPDAARVAAGLARRKGGQLIFDIHEVYHEGHLARWTFGRPIGWLSFLVKARIRSTCKQANLVVGVGKGVLQHYTRSIATPSIVVRNFAPASFAKAAPSLARNSGETLVMHGKTSHGNGTPRVLEALRGHVKPAHPVRVLMISSPNFPLTPSESFEIANSAVSIRTLPPIPHKDMPAITASCDVGMISYQRDLGVDSMPNRLFEYMAAGIAIFAPSYSVELKQILDEERIGITADFESPESIANGLHWLANNPDEVRVMGERARAAFLARHCWEAEFAQLIQAMEKQS